MIVEAETATTATEVGDDMTVAVEIARAIMEETTAVTVVGTLPAAVKM